MKKIILSLAAVLAFTLTTDAQTRKGTVLLGAGSQFSEQNINTLAITPKVGYFVQDGIAIGALVNFQTDNEDKSDYELNNQTAEIGVFGRYYVSNNLFTEISLSSKSVSSESYQEVDELVQLWSLGGEFVAPGTEGGLPAVDAVTFEPVFGYIPIAQVVEDSRKSLNFNLGLGYTIVWREHFAVEPFMNLTFMNGEAKEYNAANRLIENNDLKGTDFNLGVNFSLFF
tara:strand:+ start:111 stop:791 length:681 start_codon:yes stop_codon:yes gene_type:complete